jgi:hypothetical protein
MIHHGVGGDNGQVGKQKRKEGYNVIFLKRTKEKGGGGDCEICVKLVLHVYCTSEVFKSITYSLISS